MARRLPGADDACRDPLPGGASNARSHVGPGGHPAPSEPEGLRAALAERFERLQRDLAEGHAEILRSCFSVGSGRTRCGLEAGLVVEIVEMAREVAETDAFEAPSDSAPEKPETFALLPAWECDHTTRLMIDGSYKMDLRDSRVGPPSARDAENDSQMVRDGFVIHPHSRLRPIWDISSLFLVLYDLAMIPLSFFELPETAFEIAMRWLARLFWSIDMVLSFSTGFVTESGEIILSRRVVAKRYLKSWFSLDVMIVGFDWLELLIDWLLSNFAGFSRFGKAARILRIVRSIRLLRLVRMGDVFSGLLERFYCERVRVAFDTLKLKMIMLGLTHIVACLWYAAAGADDDANWVVHYGFQFRPFADKYLMSVRWAVSQFGGGMDEVQPRNTTESLYALFCYIGSFWSGAVFVSMLTSSMTQLHIASSQQTQQFKLLGRYLEQHHISKPLRVRLMRNARFCMAERKKNIPEDKVHLVNYISDPLCMELHFEVYGPSLSVHPFFSCYIRAAPHVMKKVCHNAMSMCLMTVGDLLFSVGEIPRTPSMYVVNRGVLAYSSAEKSSQIVSEGAWFCEAALWTHWVHRGNLSIMQDAQLYLLDALQFQSIASHFEHSTFNPSEYARAFVDQLNAVEREGAGDRVTDIHTSTEVLLSWFRPEESTQPRSKKNSGVGSKAMATLKRPSLS